MDLPRGAPKMKIWYQSTLAFAQHPNYAKSTGSTLRKNCQFRDRGPSPWPSWRSSESSTRLRDHRLTRRLSERCRSGLYSSCTGVRGGELRRLYRCFLQRAHSSRATWFGKDPSGLNVGGLLRRGDNEDFKCFSTSEECAYSRNSTVPMQSFQGTPRSEIYNLAF